MPAILFVIGTIYSLKLSFANKWKSIKIFHYTLFIFSSIIKWTGTTNQAELDLKS